MYKQNVLMNLEPIKQGPGIANVVSENDKHVLNCIVLEACFWKLLVAKHSLITVIAGVTVFAADTFTSSKDRATVAFTSATRTS